VKKIGFVLAILTLTLLVTGTTFAAKNPTTIVTNDDNSSGNTATVFAFNAKTGAAKQKVVLTTGGTGIGGGFFAAHDVSITTTKACVYVIDTGSNDIAAFTGPAGKYAKVGNYTASNSLWDYDGGALALAKDGKALYSANSASENISEWTINSDCSLTHANDYTPSGGADLFGIGLAVSPNGKYLLVSSADYGYVETFTVNSDDSLTDVAPYYFNTFSQCSSGCYPAGTVVSSDGKAIVVGNASVGQNIMFGAAVSATGKITKQTVISLTSNPQLTNPEVPILNASAKGMAQGYMGMSGYGSSYPGGVTSFTLNEKNLAKTKINSAVSNTSSADGYYGTIRNMGTWVVQASYPNTISAFQIKGTKLGKQVNSSDAQGVGLLSLEVF